MQKKYYLLFILFSLLLINCGSIKDFNFDKQWTWQDLENYSQDANTKKHVKFIKDNLNLSEAHFLFRTIDDFTTNDINKLQQMENYQYIHGGSFSNILPPSFNDLNKTPVPDNFDNTVALASYLTLARFMNERTLRTSGLGFNTRFIKKELEPIERSKKRLNVEVKTDDFLRLISLFKQKKLTKKNIEEIKNFKSVSHMLNSRATIFTKQTMLPTTDDVAEFARITKENTPVNQIWNWVSPVNNLGFSDLLNNIDEYERFFLYIEKNKELFVDRLISQLEAFLLTDIEYNQTIEFGINFPIKTWEAENYIGVNPIFMKDIFSYYFFELRKIIFSQIHPKIVIKSPNYDKNDDTYNNYWIFEDEKDNEFYSLLMPIYFEGLKNFIAGKPLGFDYMTSAKEMKGLINQFHYHIYKKPDHEAIKSTLQYSKGAYGYMTGLGYVMAKNLNKEFGIDVLSKSLYNGPVYFVKQYLEFQKINKSPKYNYFNDDFAKKIEELYKIQEPYYLK